MKRKDIARRLGATAFGLASAFAWASAQSALAQTFATKPYAEIGGWKIEKMLADGDQINCQAVAPGAAFAAFNVSSEGVVLLAGAQATGDAPIKGALALDDQASTVRFEHFYNDKIGVFLKPAQLKKIKSAKKLTITAGQETTTLALDGAAAALRKTEECNDQAGN